MIKIEKDLTETLNLNCEAVSLPAGIKERFPQSLRSPKRGVSHVQVVYVVACDGRMALDSSY
ncbi:MAG: hypothetical protein UHS51_00350 [Atopobiaceae bacterium]|nr:hypothetical protein [Atopobiaceae bacterium]